MFYSINCPLTAWGGVVKALADTSHHILPLSILGLRPPLFYAPNRPFMADIDSLYFIRKDHTKCVSLYNGYANDQ